jgi:hypothetical protein
VPLSCLCRCCLLEQSKSVSVRSLLWFVPQKAKAECSLLVIRLFNQFGAGNGLCFRGTRMALMLLHEVYGGELSPYYPFIRHLPSAFPNFLWHWDDEELERLQYQELSIEASARSWRCVLLHLPSVAATAGPVRAEGTPQTPSMTCRWREQSRSLTTSIQSSANGSQACVGFLGPAFVRRANPCLTCCLYL